MGTLDVVRRRPLHFLQDGSRPLQRWQDYEVPAHQFPRPGTRRVTDAI